MIVIKIIIGGKNSRFVLFIITPIKEGKVQTPILANPTWNPHKVSKTSSLNLLDPTLIIQGKRPDIPNPKVIRAIAFKIKL